MNFLTMTGSVFIWISAVSLLAAVMFQFRYWRIRNHGSYLANKRMYLLDKVAEYLVMTAALLIVGTILRVVG